MSSQQIKGGAADKYTVKDLADKHNVPVSAIEKEVEVGVGVEVEHTNSKEKAREIAMDHISEHPRYYTDPVHGLLANEKKLNENVVCNLEYESDKIRMAEIKSCLYDDVWDEEDVYDESDLMETEWLSKALNKGEYIDYYEMFVQACWDGIFQKQEYKGLDKKTAVSKLVNERFTKIAYLLNLTINSWSYSDNILTVRFNKNKSTQLTDDQTSNEKKLREEIRRLLNEVASDDVLLGAKLKKVLDSEEAYSILDSTEAKGSTWTSGGCGILAEALSIALRAEIYVIFNQDKGIVEHLGVRLNNGKFLDYDGPQKNWVRNFKNRELVGDAELKIIKLGPGIKTGEIPMDRKAAIRLAELIKDEI